VRPGESRAALASSQLPLDFVHQLQVARRWLWHRGLPEPRERAPRSDRPGL